MHLAGGLWGPTPEGTPLIQSRGQSPPAASLGRNCLGFTHCEARQSSRQRSQDSSFRTSFSPPRATGVLGCSVRQVKGYLPQSQRETMLSQVSSGREK